MSLTRASLVALALLALLVSSFAMPVHQGRGKILGGMKENMGRGQGGQGADTYIIVAKESNGQVGKRSTMGRCESFLHSSMMSQKTIGESGSGTENFPMVMNYTSVGIGFVAEMNQVAADMLIDMEDVDFVEKDQEIEGAASLRPIEMGYHTDRIDQRELPLDGQYNPLFTGKGVDIYIADSGISYSHTLFGGRAQFGGYDYYGADGKDCNGHGTHVAGLAGANITGAATQANLYSIKVLNCNREGKFSGLIAGISHVVERAQQSGRRSILSLSLTGSKSRSVNRALKKAYEAGIISVAAAGNDKEDACNYTPASSKHVITVGGTQERDDRLYWFNRGRGTNWGKCVDVFAPGQRIRSASHESDDHLVQMSGTSMSAPIVSGVVAMMLEEDPSLSPAEVKEKIISRGTKDVLDFSVLPTLAKADTPNLLVYAEHGPNEHQPEPTSSSSMSEPTSTQSSATQLSTELHTSTAIPSSSPFPSPSPSPSFCPTPEPKPTTPKELPEEPSMMSVLKIADALMDMDGKMKNGYIPTNLNTYKHSNEWQMTVVYSYVGDDAIKDYVILQEMQKDIEFTLDESLKEFSPIAVAAYEEDGEVFVVLVLKSSSGKDRILSTEKSRAEFEAERAEMLGQCYYPIVIRHRLVEEGESPLYIIYEKGAHVFTVPTMTLDNLINYAESEEQKGNLLTDLSYDVDDQGRVVLTAIFDEGPFAAKTSVADLTYDTSSLLSNAQVLRSLGYHVVALTPLIDSSFSQPAFLTYYRH